MPGPDYNVHFFVKNAGGDDAAPRLVSGLGRQYAFGEGPPFTVTTFVNGLPTNVAPEPPPPGADWQQYCGLLTLRALPAEIDRSRPLVVEMYVALYKNHRQIRESVRLVHCHEFRLGNPL